MIKVVTKGILIIFAIGFIAWGIILSMETIGWGYDPTPYTPYSMIMSFLFAIVFIAITVILHVEDKRG